MTTPFGLVVGQRSPVQGGETTCGPAALTVARMLADPVVAQWIITGASAANAFGDLSGDSPSARFTAYERLVHRRVTRAAAPGGGWQLPWPRALGTPPWAVCRELETIAGGRRVRYRWVVIRGRSRTRQQEVLPHWARHLTPGQPGVLYVGHSWLPRHIVLAVPTDGGTVIYNPATGGVTLLDLTDGSVSWMAGSGWPIAWFAVAAVGATPSHTTV